MLYQIDSGRLEVEYLIPVILAFHVTPFGKDNLQLVPGVSWSLLYTHFSIADFNWHPFPVINHNPEYNSFSEFFGCFQKVTEPEGDLEDPQKDILSKERSWSWTQQFTP